MKQQPPPRTPKPKSLPQQQADFTAEGSPPPGSVSGSLPPAVHKKTQGLPRPPANVPGARKGPKRGKYG